MKPIIYKQFLSQREEADGSYFDLYQNLYLFVKVTAPSIRSVETGLANIESQNVYIPVQVIEKPNTQKDQIIIDDETYHINYARKVGKEWEINVEVLYGD
jgi:hypothetical protein